MRAKFENVTIEEAKGQVSSKDASKYYGSFVIKYKDPDTNKKESMQLNLNDPLMIKQLENYEVEETLLDITVKVETTKFGTRWSDIVSIDVA